MTKATRAIDDNHPPSPREGKRLAGVVDLDKRQRQVAYLYTERMKMRTLPLATRIDDDEPAVPAYPNRCVGCERVDLPWPNRRCWLCLEYDRLHGIDAPYSGAAREVNAGCLSSEDAYDDAYLESDTIDTAQSLVLSKLQRSPTAAEIIRLTELGYTQAAIARTVGRDRKTVRKYQERYKSALEAERNDQSSPAAEFLARGQNQASGNTGRHRKTKGHFEMPCDSCGIKRRYCVGKCCTECWHPYPVQVSETKSPYKWGSPMNTSERLYWNSWPRK